jgi:hypothetical protein
MYMYSLAFCSPQHHTDLTAHRALSSTKKTEGSSFIIIAMALIEQDTDGPITLRQKRPLVMYREM